MNEQPPASAVRVVPPWHARALLDIVGARRTEPTHGRSSPPPLMHSWAGWGTAPLKRLRCGVLACGLMAAAATAAARDASPTPPCQGQAWPAHAALAAPPAVASWQAADLDKLGWAPPACTGWSSAVRSKSVVAVAGRFRFAGNADALLERAGAISTLRKVRYWSTTDKAWRPMVIDARALAGADAKSERRRDFAAAELPKGSQSYYWMDDSRSGAVVYRMRVLERDAQRLVLAHDNASPVRAYGVTLFEPGALQTVEFLERQGADVWALYLLTRIDRGASVFASGHEASSVNRAVALFRHLAGIPTDQEPPAVR